LAAALAILALRYALSYGWVIALGLPVTIYSGYVFLWARIHPRIYLGKGLALTALIISGAVTYVAVGELAHNLMWKRAFQLSGKLVEFEEPVERWRVSHPRDWSHEEQGVSGTTIHMFRPSKVTPTVFLSVTSRPNVGTSDLNLIVEGFFLNLPKGAETRIHERGTVTHPSGRTAYAVVYSEPGRRVPVKNKMLFILDESHLYVLTVGAAPLWFDRHQDYLNRLLESFQPPA
jgi:hypothetical protein